MPSKKGDKNLTNILLAAKLKEKMDTLDKEVNVLVKKVKRHKRANLLGIIGIVASILTVICATNLNPAFESGAKLFFILTGVTMCALNYISARFSRKQKKLCQRFIEINNFEHASTMLKYHDIQETIKKESKQNNEEKKNKNDKKDMFIIPTKQNNDKENSKNNIEK